MCMMDEELQTTHFPASACRNHVGGSAGMLCIAGVASAGVAVDSALMRPPDHPNILWQGFCRVVFGCCQCPKHESGSIPSEVRRYIRSLAQQDDPGVSRMDPHVVQPLGVADGSAPRAENQFPLNHP